MIELKVQSLSAGSKTVLEDLSFATQSRSLLIVGDVASGKTLLARALCGDFFDSDWIRISGQFRLGRQTFQFAAPPRDRGRCRVGLLPQAATAFFLSSTVGNEILTSQLCSAERAEVAETRLATWARESPLSDRCNVPPLALSGGQQRLFMLESVLSTSPDHLVIDGGMISLDRAFRARAESLIRGWLNEDQNRTFICFGGRAEASWFDFEAMLSLSQRHDVPYSRPRTTTGDQPGNTEVLAFRDISAGPIVNRRRLLQQVNFGVASGTYVGLKGPNGVGKSTLLRLVAGIRRPTRGEVYFLGRPLPNVVWRGLADGIAYLPQEPELAGPTASGPRSRRVGEIDGDRRNFWQTFFELEWEGDAETYWSMSSGQRTRASLLFQAIYDPRLWILDEPTFRLDAAEMIRFLVALRVSRPDTSAIVVSHDEEFLNAISDQTYEMTESGVQRVDN